MTVTDCNRWISALFGIVIMSIAPSAETVIITASTNAMSIAAIDITAIITCLSIVTVIRIMTGATINTATFPIGSIGTAFIAIRSKE